MKTEFCEAQLADANMAASEAVIRKCVHCGFCIATCPTYVLLGDELDSPRGRIYLMKHMLEQEQTPSSEVVKHVDRCLSCMTTCPSDVNYMHLVDHARSYIEEHYRRPWHERAVRGLLAAVLPHRERFRMALELARVGRPLAPLFARARATRPLAAMLRLAPRRLPPEASANPARIPDRRGTVALLQGCAEPVLRPETRAATVRLLNRVGYDVVFAPDERCCGALVHHMGRKDAALENARANVDAWTRLIERETLDAIIVATSGCGTTIKDYGFMLRDDPAYADRAARVSGLASDVSEFFDACEMPAGEGHGLRVAYHSACSLQHGQRVNTAPRRLLERAGFDVSLPAESHLCCGSAGTYNILQPDIAGRLAERKVENIARLDADVIAAGNIGCMVQIGTLAKLPVVHTVELLDWATGGPMPSELASLSSRRDP